MIFSFDETVAVLMIIGALMFILGLSVRRDLLKKKPKKQDKKKEKAVAALKKLKEDVTPPVDVVLPPLSPNQETKGLEQFPIPRVIQIELTRMKEGGRRVTMRTGKVTLIPRLGNGKENFWFPVGKAYYFIDPSKIITVKTKVGRKKNREVVTEKLVYDVLSSEPLDSEGKLTWSWDVEHLWRDSALDQYVTVATFEGGFQLTPVLVRILIVVGALGLLMGLALNGSAHLVPTTVIHWVP